MSSKQHRIKNALWGLFIGDALSMPAHWYYNVSNISKTFGGFIEKYEAPQHPHVEAFMVGGSYKPEVEKAKMLGRKYDILHDHAKFYQTSYTDFSASGFIIDDKGMIAENDRYHYHHGLQAGENTLNAHLVRVLMRQVIKSGKYNQQLFLEDFIDFLTTPGNNKDPYTEGYIRAWFENFSRGIPAYACAANQRENAGINGLGGLIRPLVLSMLTDNGYKSLGLALEHQNLSHRSENIASSLSVLVPMLQQLIEGKAPEETFKHFTSNMHLPEFTGLELFREYEKYGGMPKVPKDAMFDLHTSYKAEQWNLEKFAEENSEAKVQRKLLSTACYLEHGTPLLLYTAWKNKFDFESSLLKNVNAGGDNVHRGMVLGLLLGATANDLPQDLINGLVDKKELEQEINAFAKIALEGKAL
ncbi:MAG: ADP-ribosylglycohydrolase family protein [Bacteroidales bacterium]|nr:ADP-ribosylglycohydrolase family protein [Bacteroidales bacterium]